MSIYLSKVPMNVLVQTL